MRKQTADKGFSLIELIVAIAKGAGFNFVYRARWDSVSVYVGDDNHYDLASDDGAEAYMNLPY